MKYIIGILSSQMLLLGLYASDISKSTNTDEFPYIKPITVEYIVQPKAFKSEKNHTSSIKSIPVVEVDSDSDGVPDSKDKCQNTDREFKVDTDGCPQKTILQTHFPTNGYAVSNKLISELESFAKFLKDNTKYLVHINGYTDSSGDAYKNKILSQNRANSVRTVLIGYGIDNKRLISIGRGSANPIADNATVDGRTKNRRIEAELTK